MKHYQSSAFPWSLTRIFSFVFLYTMHKPFIMAMNIKNVTLDCPHEDHYAYRKWGTPFHRDTIASFPGIRITQNSTILECKKGRLIPTGCRSPDGTVIQKGHLHTMKDVLVECSEIVPGNLTLETIACRVNDSRSIYPNERFNITEEISAICEKDVNGQLRVKIAGCIDKNGIYVDNMTTFERKSGQHVMCHVATDGIILKPV